jgi:hypothetical protein
MNAFASLAVKYLLIALIVSSAVPASDVPLTGLHCRVIPSKYVFSPINNVLVFKTYSDELLVVILRPAPGSVFESTELDSWLHGYTCETFMTIPESSPHHDSCVWVGTSDLPHALAKIKKTTTRREVPIPQCETFLLTRESVGWQLPAEKK